MASPTARVGRLATFIIAASVTAAVALLELHDRPTLPLFSTGVGWATGSLFDILYGGVIVTAAIDICEMIWRAAKGEDQGEGVRSGLRPQLVRSAVTAGAACGILIVMELGLSTAKITTSLPLPLAVMLGASACGLYQLFAFPLDRVTSVPERLEPLSRAVQRSKSKL